MNNFLIGLFSSSLFVGILLILEYVTRKNNYKRELTRRLAHFLSGLFGIVMGLTLDSWVFITFAIIFFGVISISYTFKFFTSIHGVKRKTFGEILIPIGILIPYLITGPTVTFIAAVLILAISDPLAGIVWDLKIFNKTKWLSSVFFLISAFVILFFLLKGHQITLLLIIALIVTIVEKYSKYGTDNLTVPLSTSLLLMAFF